MKIRWKINWLWGAVLPLMITCNKKSETPSLSALLSVHTWKLTASFCAPSLYYNGTTYRDMLSYYDASGQPCKKDQIYKFTSVADINEFSGQYNYYIGKESCQATQPNQIGYWRMVRGGGNDSLSVFIYLYKKPYSQATANDVNGTFFIRELSNDQLEILTNLQLNGSKSYYAIVSRFVKADDL